MYAIFKQLAMRGWNKQQSSAKPGHTAGWAPTMHVCCCTSVCHDNIAIACWDPSVYTPLHIQTQHTKCPNGAKGFLPWHVPHRRAGAPLQDSQTVSTWCAVCVCAC